MANNNTLYPNPLASRKEKGTEKYGKAMFDFIWENYTKLSPLMSEVQSRYRLNRQYAEGLESVLDMRTMMGAKNTAYLNIDITPVNYISKIKDIIVEILMTQPFTIQCEPLDPESKIIEEEERKKIAVAMFLKKNAGDIEQLTGIPIVPPNMELPADDESLELYFAMKGKMGLSLAMEEALNFVLQNNDFDYTIKKQMLTDLVVLKRTSIMRDYDEDFNIKISCPDFLDLLFPYSKTEGFNNIPYVGVLQQMTIEQIGRIAKKPDGSPRYTEKELMELAQLQAGRNGNPNWQAGWNYGYEGYYNSATLIRPYYNFNIPVVRFWFLSNCTEYLVKNSKDGKDYYDWKTKPYDDSNESENVKENVATRIKQWRFEGYAIPNSKYIFNYKESDYIEREKVQGGYSPNTMLPIEIIAPDIYDMENKSLVEKAIPFEKQVNLIEQKIQQFLVKAAPPGYSINQSALEGVKMGKGNTDLLDPLSLNDLFVQTGSIVHNSSDMNGNPSNAQPILPLPNGFGQGLSDLLNLRRFYVQAINDVMGFNEVMTASLPSNDTPVGTQQMARQATINSLMPLYRAAINVLERSLKGTACMIQDCISKNKEGFIQSIGLGATTTIDVFKKLPLASLGIKVKLGSTEQEMADVLNLLNIDLQNQVITTSDYLRIKKQLKQNPDAAAQLLIMLENKRRDARMEESQAQQEANAQVQQQSLQMASQLKQQEMDLEVQAKIALLQAEYQAKNDFEEKQFQRNMQIQQAKNIGIENVAQINAGKSVQVQQISSEGKIREAHSNNNTKLAVKSIEHESKLKHSAFQKRLETEDSGEED